MDAGEKDCSPLGDYRPAEGHDDDEGGESSGEARPRFQECPTAEAAVERREEAA